MVREHSVRLKELAACCISSKRLKNLIYKEAGSTVSAVYNNVKTSKRLVTLTQIFKAISNLIFKIICINGKQIHMLNRSIYLSRIQKRCKTKNLCNIFMFKPAIIIKKLNSITIKRKMAGCNHSSTIKVCFREHNRHKHCRSCCHSTIYNSSTCTNHSFNQSICKSRACNTRVTANTNMKGC